MLEPNFNDFSENNAFSQEKNNNAKERPLSTFTQDRDLFARLSQYFDAAEINLRQGRGWFIFNVDRNRAMRLVRFVSSRLQPFLPQLTYSIIPWRDFSLNSYMLEVELGDNERNQQQLDSGDPHLKQELNIARRVSYDTSFTMLTCDLLVVSGVQPRQRHEIRRLEYVVGKRQMQRLATMLITPYQPHQLAEIYEDLDVSADFWNNLYRPMYENGLLAF